MPIILTNGADTFTGTAGDDFIKALDGWDSVAGGKGSDTISGAEGDDSLSGDAGNDVLLGEDGDDVLRGGSGDDLMDGGSGLDWVDYSGATGPVDVNIWDTAAQNTGQGWDTLLNIDHLSGSVFNDYLAGNSDDNWILGGGGSDSINAGEGADLVDVSAGDHVLWGGAGFDTLSFYGNGAGVTGPVIASLALQGTMQVTGQGTMYFEGFEGLTGTVFDDQLEGDDGDNVLNGNAGDDLLKGQKGDDILFGDGMLHGRTAWSGNRGMMGERPDMASEGFAPGKDTLDGGEGNDRLMGGQGADQLYGGDGADTFIYRDVADSGTGGGARDQIRDLEKIDTIDLSAIDADVTASGDQAFTVVGAFSGTAGELVLDWDPSVGSTFLRVDVDGDGRSDMEVEILGNWSSFSGFVL